MPTLTPAIAGLLPTLRAAVNDLALLLTDQQLEQLLYYVQQLMLWNKAYNLTAIKDPATALIKHVVDSLAIINHLPEGDLLDIGTGAGLPAVIIAICQPNRQVTALDSNQKKIRFVKQVASELGLKNLHPVASRIEEHTASYAVITSRAFASLTDFVQVSEPLLAEAGSIIAMKGVPPLEEMDVLCDAWLMQVIELNVPYLHEQRHLIGLQRR